ncbi:hypothetical protein IAR55_004134 [Kwoniella newhampshirensis]|uniref:Protein PBN1 n=1 Tax=Kwoniella newhampshirensis TaxID=1651941 RepID=A0AAW0YMQ9_9TREE
MSSQMDSPPLDPLTFSSFPLNLTLSLPNPPSLHPVLQLTVHQPLPTHEECAQRLPLVYLTLRLPDQVFVDPDELSGRWGDLERAMQDRLKRYRGGLGSMDERGYGQRRGQEDYSDDEGKEVGKILWWDVDPPKVDVERPSFVSDPDLDEEEGHVQVPLHTLSLILRPSIDRSIDRTLCSEGTKAMLTGVENAWSWGVDVPLHARYLAPSEDGTRSVVIPAVSASRGGSIHSAWICGDPDILASPDIWQTLADTHPDPVTIPLPTGRHSHQLFVERITPSVIWLGCFYLIYKILRVRNRAGRQRVERERISLMDDAEGLDGDEKVNVKAAAGL